MRVPLDSATVSFYGPTIDDDRLLSVLPVGLRDLLRETNGFVQFGGGLHVRGVCSEPVWHSLEAAWHGPHALHRLFVSVAEGDVPFAQDCLGDQFLLREGRVVKLVAEIDEIEEVGETLRSFLEKAQRDPVDFLGLQPLLAFQGQDGQLSPGQLLHVYPPFCTAESKKGVSYRAVPIAEALQYLSHLSSQLRDMKPGTKFSVEVKEDDT